MSFTRSSLVLLLGAAALAGCARSEAIRTSADTFVIATSAEPSCGMQGAARVAAQMAAIQTIRSGYDRYVILDGAAANNTVTVQMPGTYRSFGSMDRSGGASSFRTSSVYVPGRTIVTGSRDQSLSVKMYAEDEPGAETALSARETLGPDWQEKAARGVNMCN